MLKPSVRNPISRASEPQPQAGPGEKPSPGEPPVEGRPLRLGVEKEPDESSEPVGDGGCDFRLLCFCFCPCFFGGLHGLQPGADLLVSPQQVQASCRKLSAPGGGL